VNLVVRMLIPKLSQELVDLVGMRFRISNWFQREDITTDIIYTNKLVYIISSAVDDTVRVFKEKEAEINRALSLDEFVDLVKRKYWRENQNYNKLRQI